TPANETPEKPEPTPEEIARYQKLAQADRLYQCGSSILAERLYREVKEPFAAEVEFNREIIPQSIYESEQLPPGGAVYWRLYQQGLENKKLKSKILIPLKLLVEQYPEFIPGHLRYAEALAEYGQEEDSLKVLQQAVILYPSEPDLVLAKIEADEARENWLEASITARQFALFNRDHFRSPEFMQIAQENLERYQDDLHSDLTKNTIGSIITGGLSYALTGYWGGPFSALETTVLLLQGESAVGDRFSQSLQKELPLLTDAEVLDYVREIGNQLASVAGRDEFNYEFYVIMDDRLNAFALPGGKIFINAGAITKTNSEAELAGLIAHELSHAVLSHSFQLMAQGTLTVNVVDLLPYVGPFASDLIVLNYSRDMEQQADSFGTRLLAANGYAADGVRNLMVTLEKQDDNPSPPAWLSTHPDTKERIHYLEELIVRQNFNRYAYEGVVRHQEIRQKVERLLGNYQKSRE
ncbi:MAG: M48 family metalloprotease, partial [Microcystaceae cyanobacterium]